MDVDCEEALPLGESREATREQQAKEDASVRGGEREEKFSSLHSVDLSFRQRFMAGQPGARVKSIILNCG